MKPSPLRTLASTLLAAALILVSPGLGCYRAAAAALEPGESGAQRPLPIHALGGGLALSQAAAFAAISGPSSLGGALQLPGLAAGALLGPSALPRAASEAAPIATALGAGEVAPEERASAQAAQARPEAGPAALQRAPAAAVGKIEKGVEAVQGQAADPTASGEAVAGQGETLQEILQGEEGASASGAVKAPPAGASGITEADALTAAGASAQPLPPPRVGRFNAAGGLIDPKDQERGIWGMAGNRLFSMIAQQIGTIAVSVMIIGAIGPGNFLTQAAIGAGANIAMALLAGKVAANVTLKNYVLGNIALRSAIYVANGVFWKLGWVTYGPLLALTILSSWQFQSMFVLDPSLQTAIVGTDKGKLRSTEALIRMTTILVTVVAGLVVGPAMVKDLGYFWTFILMAAIQALSIPVMNRALPDGIGETGPRPGLGRVFSESAASLAGWLSRLNWRQAPLAAAFALSLATFLIPLPWAPFLYFCPVPLMLVSGFALLRSRGFRELIVPHPMLRASLAFIVLGAIIELPLRNSVFGVLAKDVFSNKDAAAAYLGSLMAAFYLGQLPSGTGILDPKLKVSLGRFSVSLREMMKWVGAASVAAWTTFVLIPKPALAMLVSWLQPWAGIDLLVAATVGLYLVLHHLTPRLSDSTWMKVEAGALLLIGLPLFFWGSPWALYLSVAVLGFALNGSQRMISATFWSASKQVLQGDQFEYVNGIRQAFFNIAMSLGVALYAVAQAVPALFSGNPHAHAFPFTWYVLAGLFALCAALFVRGSKLFAVEKDKK